LDDEYGFSRPEITFVNFSNSTLPPPRLFEAFDQNPIQTTHLHCASDMNETLNRGLLSRVVLLN